MSDYLAHHGRLHMKWGIKNGPPYPLGSNVTKGYAKRQEAHDDYKKAHNKGEHKKSVKEMSDAELRSRINRLQMEQQYKNMSDTYINRGRKAVKAAIATLGTTAAVTGGILTISKNAPQIKAGIKAVAKSMAKYSPSEIRNMSATLGSEIGVELERLMHSAKNSE